jgi:hypothetical protein
MTGKRLYPAYIGFNHGDISARIERLVCVCGGKYHVKGYVVLHFKTVADKTVFLLVCGCGHARPWVLKGGGL